ncbi:MAG: M42 family metallopeptidase [Saprospiraceae bacterium]
MSPEQFLRSYINNPSPTGHEAKGQQMWLEYIKPFADSWDIDDYGTGYAVINPGQEYKVVIEAHADEISWFVNYITDNGLIHVIRNGGSDNQIAPSKRVNIHTDNGIVKGVFGWPAIHTRTNTSEDPKTSIENLFIDIGAKDKEEVLKLGILVGNVMTYEDEFFILNDNYYCGRALDNRLGGFCIAEVARRIKEQQIQLPYSLYIVNAVQEEVGLRGAEMIAQRIRPNAAIIIDVTHDTSTPHMNKKKDGDVKCGEGPTVTYAPSVHQKLLRIVTDIATEKTIPFQRQASSRSTGTDTDAFAYSNQGVPSVLISIPLRYMHTTVEMAHKKDIENVIQLIVESLQKIEKNHNFKYF